MTEEIKRIIEELKDNIPIEEYRSEGTSDGSTHYEEDKDSWQYKLLDYITNLQQENEKLKYNARGQVNDYFKDKYVDEVLKNAELKKENERLNSIIYRKISNYILKKYGMLDDTHYHDFLNELELKESGNNE